MNEKDYYKILEISKDASQDDIKKAYRNLAKKYHPDKNQGNKEAEEKFKDISEAYEILGNPEKRNEYDNRGNNIFSGRFEWASSMSDIFNEFFGNGHRESNRPKQRVGSTLRIKVRISLNDADTGINKTIKLRKLVSCESCNGTGSKDKKTEPCNVCKGAGYIDRIQSTSFGIMSQREGCKSCNCSGVHISNPCPNCNGRGVKLEEQTLDINIPSGVDNGDTLVLNGLGNMPENGGIPGDLQVIIEIEPHETLIRRDRDLIYNLLIPLTTAILGGECEVDTLNGKLKIKIESGIQSGKILRIKGKGIHDKYGEVGDLLIIVSVFTPDINKLTEEEKDIINKLSESENIKPSKEDYQEIYNK